MPRGDLSTIAVDPEVRRALLSRGGRLQARYGHKLTYNQILRELLGLSIDGSFNADEKKGGSRKSKT